MSGYTIRAAGVEDLDVVLRHRRRMFEDMGYTDAGALDAVVAVSTPLIERGLREETYRAWFVLDEQGRVVAGAGVIILTFQPHARDPRAERAWIVNVFTEPEHRRKGLARTVVRAAVDWCRGAGMKYVFLHASDDGRALYEGLGFRPTGEMRLEL
jgi:GNAT superfamily N-acetyltransferase